MIRTTGRSALLVAAAMCLAGCGGVGGSTSVASVCAGTDLMCEKAVPIAAARLGGIHGAITDTHWNVDVCGPGVRCFPGDGTDFGWVIFEFQFGDPVMIHVSSVRQADGEGFELVTDAQQVPPPWVLERLDRPGP